MNPGLVVKLRPAGPWRIGPDSGARNRVDVIYHSDSLFSAVCSAMARLGRLDEWLHATARAADPAVRFSSCFPFLDELGFVVPPRTMWPPVSPAHGARVRWKSARFVPLTIVQALRDGKILDDNHWTVDGASQCLLPVGRPGPFRTSVRWSAAVDRLTGVSDRHATACIEFRPGAGLWMIVSFVDDAAWEHWGDAVKAAFRVLADSGFGGERSRGWGRAEQPEFIDGMLPDMILPQPGTAPEQAAAGVTETSEAPGTATLEAEAPAVAEAAETSVAPLAATPEAGPPAAAEPAAAEATVTSEAPGAAALEADASAVAEAAETSVAPPAATPEAGPPAAAGAAAAEATVTSEVPGTATLEADASAVAEAAETSVAPPAATPEAEASIAAEPAAAVPPGESASDAELATAGTTESPAPAAESTATGPTAAEAAVRAPSPSEPFRMGGGDTPEPPAPPVEEPPPAPAPEREPPEPSGPPTEEPPAQEPPPTSAPEREPSALPHRTAEAHAEPGPAQPSTRTYWMLSLFIPSLGDGIDWTAGNYTVVTRGGRIESPAAHGGLKKQIQMVTEGSVLCAGDDPRGSAADVAPDGFAHPVFRSGFALSIPLGGEAAR